MNGTTLDRGVPPLWPEPKEGESITVEYYDGDYDDEYDRTCTYCGGDGGDPWNDGIVECPECDGEGYRWWE